MKWTPKSPRLSASKIGDYRIIHKFAFLPVLCNDGVKVWLEKYWIEQECEYKYKLFNRLTPFQIEKCMRDKERYPALYNEYTEDKCWVTIYICSMPCFPNQDRKKYISIDL